MGFTGSFSPGRRTIKSVDVLGRLTLPSDIRTHFEILPDAKIAIVPFEHHILMRQYNPVESKERFCPFCGEESTEDEDGRELYGLKACGNCVKLLLGVEESPPPKI